MSNAGGGTAGTIAITAIANRVDSAGKMDPASGYLVGAGGNMGGNHPVSIPYAGETYGAGNLSGVPATSVGPAVVGGYYSTTTTGCTSPSGVCTTAPATDGRNGAAINLIPYAAGTTTNLGVECSTCHEPHNRYGLAYLGRVDVANASGLCQSCHNK